MGRPKPKRASSVFFAHPKPLKASAQGELLRTLGYSPELLARAEVPGYQVLTRSPGAPLLLRKDPSNVSLELDPFEAIRRVEVAIALAIDGAEHLDTIPRPADYRQEFERLRTSVAPVLRLVTGWSDYYRDQFKLRGHDIHALEQALAALFDVSIAVGREMKGKPSKGARKQVALQHAVQQLLAIFRDYYQGDTAKSKQTELKFVRTALEAGRVVPIGYEGLGKLIRTARQASP